MVFGTLDHPVHAVNLRETLQLIELNYQDTTVIGIDACLGAAGQRRQLTPRVRSTQTRYGRE